MPYNGSGTFVRSYNWVNDAASSIPITASRMDGDANDFAGGLSNAITRDGQGVPTAAISWGNQNLTSVGAFAAASGAFAGNVSVAGNLSVTGTFTPTGTINASAANFSGAVAADSFTVNSNSGARGYIGLVSGTSTVTGYVQFLNLSGASQGYIGQVAASGAIQYVNQNGNGHNFVGGNVTMPANLTVAGSLSAGQTSITTSGSSGSISITDTGGSGAGIALTGNGATTPRKFLRANGGQFQIINDGYSATILTLSDAGALTTTGGISTTGTVTATGNISGGGSVIPNSSRPNVNFQTSGTTSTLSLDANDFLQYDQTNNKLYLFIGGTAVWSVDSSGNMIAKGNVTANGTP